MDWKTHLLEAVEKGIRDSLPGKEVNIHVTIPEQLREGDGIIPYLFATEATGTKTDPIWVGGWLLPKEEDKREPE
jgi:hypothetical protein